VPVIYVDVDDTLVRSAGTKRIPIPAVIASVRSLKASGARLFLWSTGGAEYARATALELEIADCFDKT
jgi:FMN phosphatase YigB (HAD superfamily)